MNEECCVVPECRSLSKDGSLFCLAHDAEWQRSPERGRLSALNSASMVADFVRRVWLEARAGR